MTLLHIVEFLGSGFGICGALLLSSKLASQQKWRLLAFLFYLSSNIFWFAFAINLNAQGLMVMNVFYLLSSINGVRNNWLFKGQPL